MVKTMKLACDECGATGRIRTESGHVDICGECFGLGYIEVEKVEETPERKKMISHFYMIISTFMVLLVVYYLGLYITLLTYGFSFLVTMVLFVGGHVAIFGGFLFFVTLKLLKDENVNDNME